MTVDKERETARPQRPASAAASHAAYRPDIDGLRALSILAVVAFHAFPGVLPSGYVGVDVFFVISGYLIGGLISAELADGTFSFANFYARRVRRIFPALLLVLVFVLVVGWNVMFPDEFRLLGRHVTAAALFVSNFPLMGEIGYFDADGHTKPLLHLWSLGIEEQFYLVWPLLAVLTRRNARLFLAMTLAVALVTFIINLNTYPALAFYQPWSRFWELAVGVLAAHIPLPAAARWRAAARPREIACWGGLALIAIGAVFGNLETFPGWWAAVPVMGAALAIASGPDTRPSRALLAARPMVFVGKISYPLYLWHWPLLVFARIACGSYPPAWLTCSMVVLAFVLAWLTYTLVEKPARFRLPSRQVVGFCVPVMAVLGVMGFIVMNQDGFADRRVVEANRALVADVRIPTTTRISDGSCAKAYGIDAAPPYVCQVNSAAPEMLIIGDSISMAFHAAISVGAVDAKAVLVAAPGPSWFEPECFTVQALETWDKGDATCQRVVRDALAILDRTPSIRALVVSPLSGNPFFNDPQHLRALRDAVSKRGRMLVLVGAPPGFFHPPEGCRPRRLDLLGLDFSAPSDPLSCRDGRLNGDISVRVQKPVFREIAGEAPHTLLFDALPLFCDNRYCYQSDERGPLYWSWGHVNERGSAKLLRVFLPWLRKATND